MARSDIVVSSGCVLFILYLVDPSLVRAQCAYTPCIVSFAVLLLFLSSLVLSMLCFIVASPNQINTALTFITSFA